MDHPFLRFPVDGAFAARMRTLADSEKFDMEVPFMACFPSDRYSLETIRKDWNQATMISLITRTLCNRSLSVVPLTLGDDRSDAQDFSDMPFIVLMETPALHSYGLAINGTVGDIIHDFPAITIRTGRK